MCPALLKERMSWAYTAKHMLTERTTKYFRANNLLRCDTWQKIRKTRNVELVGNSKLCRVALLARWKHHSKPWIDILTTGVAEHFGPCLCSQPWSNTRSSVVFPPAVTKKGLQVRLPRWPYRTLMKTEIGWWVGLWESPTPHFSVSHLRLHQFWGTYVRDWGLRTDIVQTAGRSPMFGNWERAGSL